MVKEMLISFSIHLKVEGSLRRGHRKRVGSGHQVIRHMVGEVADRVRTPAPYDHRAAGIDGALETGDPLEQGRDGRTVAFDLAP